MKRRTRVVWCALVLALSGLACAVPTSDTVAGPATGGVIGAAAPGPAQNPDDFIRDVNGALAEAQRYWTGRWSAAGRQFQPVRQVLPYRRAGEISCGGQPLPENNAVYCPAGDFIAFDVDFALVAFDRIGDAFVYYLLGHEYAHGVQARLRGPQQLSIEVELQADCMAGAFIGDSVRANRLTIEDTDLDEFRNGLLAVGDDPSVPWFAEGAHGTAEQRTEAFFNGYERSLAPCGVRI